MAKYVTVSAKIDELRGKLVEFGINPLRLLGNHLKGKLRKK